MASKYKGVIILMKRSIFFLIFAVGGVLLLAYFVTQNQRASQQEANLSGSLEAEKSTYSFYEDSDLDGLSNAEEVIYGSKSDTTDTDGDSYSDGEEVDNGYDPIVAGSAKLSDRKNLSTTIRYFSWLREEKAILEPKIEDFLLSEFLSSRNELLSLEEVSDDAIEVSSSNSKDAIRAYLAEVNKVGLPEGLVSYKEISTNFSEEGDQLLGDLLGKIELSYLDFSYIETHLAAKDIQEGYLTVIKNFSNIFSDLRYNKENPVQIEINLRKASKLIERSQMIEQLKLELIQKYEIS